MANKLTTLGYFKKRMRDCGYVVDDIYRNYAYTDPRAWTVVIDPEVSNIFCTCYVNANKNDLVDALPGDFYFELFDGGQFIPGKLSIKTSSIEILIEYLVKFGINNKSQKYNNIKPQNPVN